MFSPVIKIYDTISPTDMQPHLLQRFQVEGTFGKGVIVTIQKGGTIISFDAVDGDTPQSIAQKIAAAWNEVYPTQGNTVAPVNAVASYDAVVQLVSQPYDYSPFNVFAEYKEPIETPAVTVVEALETETKKSNNLLWLGAGGLLLFFLLRKKKKGAK